MKRIIAAILMSAVLSGIAFGVSAQPHHGRADLGAVLQDIKSQLKLNTSQQQQWDNAMAQSQAARDTMRANLGQLKAALKAELANPVPDLAAVATVSDDIQQQNASLRKQARDAWLALYANFTTDQKQLVRDALNARMQRMEAFRQKLQDRTGS